MKIGELRIARSDINISDISEMMVEKWIIE